MMVVSDSSSSTDCALLELWAMGICPLPEANGSEQHFSFAEELLQCTAITEAMAGKQG